MKNEKTHIVTVWYTDGHSDVKQVPEKITVVDYAFKLVQNTAVDFVATPHGVVRQFEDGTYLFNWPNYHKLTPPKARPSFREQWKWAVKLASEALNVEQLLAEGRL